MGDHKYITSLFKKYVSDSCTSSELQELIDIIQSGQEEELIQTLIREHLQEESFLPVQVPDRVFAQLDLDQPKVVVRRISRFFKVAAAVAVIAVLAAVFYFAPSSGGRDVADHDVPPGESIATLVLADGTEQALNALITSVDNGSVAKAADGQLEYIIDRPVKNGKGTNSIRTPKGGQFRLVLPDGSRVWLNAASDLTYPASFGHQSRVVQLSGEAYFEVAPQKVNGKSIPFFVETKNQKIEVLGTRFNVSAYEDGNSTKTTLIEGKVKVVTDDDAIILKPNQEFSLRPDGANTQEVDVEMSIDWKNGDFLFVEEDIRSIMRKVARWYNVEIIYEGDDKDFHENISGQISRNRNLSEVLRMLELSGNARFAVKDRKITVYNSR